MRLGDDVGAQGIVSGQAAELNEELVARYVVNPGRSHGLLKGSCLCLRIARCGDAFDAAELRQGVDPVSVERVDEL